MGDMADFVNESGWDEVLGWVGWWPLPSSTVICKHCGRKGFRWGKRPEGWRLVTKTGKVHKCKSYIKKKEEIVRRKIND